MAITAAHVARAPRIRLGMVGGGRGAFIGAVHRIAARLDDQYELVAGAFSSDPEKSAASAADLGVARSYGSYAEMAQKEARRKDGIEAVAIVTPNHMHAPVAVEFLKRGIHVICDKPLTATLPEAKKLAKTAEASGVVFALTHNYTGYPMIRQAREMIAAGALGDIRLVNVEYIQDWLAEPIEATGQKQADWRTDPARSGAGGATGGSGLAGAGGMEGAGDGTGLVAGAGGGATRSSAGGDCTARQPTTPTASTPAAAIAIIKIRAPDILTRLSKALW